MSGEYYCTEESVPKFYKECENPSPKSLSNKDGCDQGQGQGYRLHDIEEQLEMAENRCNTLKDQLDYMKQIYGVKKNIAKSRKISNTSPTRRNSDDNLTSSSISMVSGDQRVLLKRQNSNAIGTDNTGAAVRTINNILNGITESVNRLSELHVQASETPRSRTESAMPPRHVVQIHATNVNQTSSKDFIGDPEFPSALKSAGISNKSKNIKRKIKESKLAARKLGSSQSVKRPIRVDRRTKINAKREPQAVDKLPALTMPVRRDVLRTVKARSPDKLVEIYHNKEARNSDSDEGHNVPRTRVKLSEVASEEVPPLDIPNQQSVVHNKPASQNGYNNTAMGENFDSGTYFDPPEAPRAMQSYYKNYALPTIASRMKQVAKSYLNAFNFKAIPFCAAISTSPSHNIGINIQQVMNIIKNRQTVNGISPTLAHNIGLAAERIHSRPLTALVSTINSRTSYRPSQCPLSRPALDYRHLQDMAKGIPEETAEEVEADSPADSPATKTVLITGPSGDAEVRTANAPSWSAGAGGERERCTCVSQPAVGLRQVADKCRRPPPPGTAMTSITTVSHTDKHRSKQNKTKSRLLPKRPSSVSNHGYVVDEQHNQSCDHPLQGKEKNLKEVLMNLHNEFESLNKRYEQLSQKADADDDGTLRELETLESELNKKEEEITMVMTLYKEVLALKQQIKTLKQKTSQSSVTCQEQKETTPDFKEYNNPQAAFHLTKLLKQIQTYQLRYKKE